MSERMSDAIAVSALSVVFGEGAARNVAVDRVSFTVPTGGSFGLVGESGSGKSTVLRAIAGLIRDWTGAIAVAGRQLGHRRERGFYRTVQMVFQDPYASLHPRHTVDRILSEPLMLHRFDRIEERIEEGLEAVGLGAAFRFRYPHQLSGGQRQRVAIARAGRFACRARLDLSAGQPRPRGGFPHVREYRGDEGRPDRRDPRC
jgi:peptide/nickel transport system ATP-binding protein